ncbi:MAG: hypothetical protein EPN97_18090 [Alphaproteobacteria bacterium]|nr:MAG: hypothetical protein EPN97_18090 [Alphaproteobacteria bacterium]
MSADSPIRNEWKQRLFDTSPADRAAADSAVRNFYAAACLSAPRIVWFESPIDAAWAVAALTETTSWLGKQVLGTAQTAERAKAEQARAKLSAALGLDWKSVVVATGAPLGSSFMCVGAANIHQQIVSARMELGGGDVSALFRVFDDKDELFKAEKYLLSSEWGVLCAQPSHYTLRPVLSANFYRDYSFSTMAEDESNAKGPVPAILTAAWNVARSAGLWWPFAGLAVLSDRPAELHRNDNGLLHRGDGPAAVFRDGNVLYAWKGQSMKEQWILQPDKIPPGQLKQLDADFRKYVTAKAGGKPAAKPKVSAILSADLSGDVVQRIDALRKHAGGKLLLYDRYVAGEHKKIWIELAALGRAVREAPHAADALAVAYETMRRVDANIRTITLRLQGMKYMFRHPKDAHVPPDKKAQKLILEFEKSMGDIPLSLRAFYEVVGSVDWMGRHPALSPGRSSIASDPLVVFPAEPALAEAGDGEQGAIPIAPDDLHKDDVSGGAPYELMFPDPRADGEVLNERHSLFFVEYLRLCLLGFGGFPGYEGTDTAPGEIAALRDGLEPF